MGILLAGFYLSVEIKEDERDGMCLVGEKRNTYRVLVGKPEKKRTPEDLGIHVKMDLEEICVRVQTEFILLRIGTGGRLL